MVTSDCHAIDDEVDRASSKTNIASLKF